ncbi:glycosyltransferase family 4 protein [Salinibacterium sp. NSLL150]|uniref:glycosyltransferase n=1 Tax=unclassified Salinibacterium TaxID=2632331 RepID=UPI0018CE649C|nr:MULTISPECIES: glycosyltransferase [unclassified Salinibacterium]MBH0099106.1 glycosyltransferase family 4 protein [Salinibacterium sp. NSLL35]MBH0101860.1 glycosyltransferase family 4 protein [Salinibacterium sp. NSLL150]MBH0104620.1 glycosyltransferase family 4 protein [Salinibacterium sp. NSLL16]MBH0107380.1 glycosyltransferase family 4 protein [Salinibacterium sp. NSLL17]
MHIAHVTSFYSAPALLPSSAVRSRGLAYQAAGHEFSIIIPGAESSVTWTEYGTVVTVPARGRALSRGFVPIAKAVRRALEKLVPDQIEVADRLSARELGAWARDNRVPAVLLTDDDEAEWATAHTPLGFDQVIHTGVVGAQGSDSATHENSSTATDPATTSAPDNRVVSIPSGVNVEVFSPLRHNSTLRDSSGAELVVVCAAPLTSAGAVSVAIDAVRHRASQGEDLHLVILGDGPLRARLERSAVGISVQFLSAHDLTLVERAEVFATADLAIVTTNGSCAQAIALESLATGTPTIITTASKEHIAFADGGGLTVAPDLTHIAHALRVLADIPVEERRGAARTTALPHDSFAQERRMIAMHETLATTLNDQPAPSGAVPS